MAGGKPWTDEENELLLTMLAENLSFQEILDSNEFSERTAEAIKVQIRRLGRPSVDSKQPMFEAIEPSPENLSLEQVIKLFSSAFKQICNSRKVDKCDLERFRLVFQAARDYGPLLSHFEKWESIEKQIKELSAAVAELQAAKDVKPTS